jgi:Flp pilus assembly protein TadD
LDSRGLTNIRLGNYGAAINDYDAALGINPTMAGSLYGRGVARIKSGNLSEGNADIAEAMKLEPNVTERMARSGIAP